MTESAIGPRYGRWDRGMLAFTSVLFVVALLRWAGWIGGLDAYRPAQFVLLSAALMLQPLAAVVGRRSRPAFHACLVASMLLLGMVWRATS